MVLKEVEEKEKEREITRKNNQAIRTLNKFNQNDNGLKKVEVAEKKNTSSDIFKKRINRFLQLSR